MLLHKITRLLIALGLFGLPLLAWSQNAFAPKESLIIKKQKIAPSARLARARTSTQLHFPPLVLPNKFSKDSLRLGFWQNAPQPHKRRLIGISSFAGISYTTTMVSVSQLWYANYEQGPFHFFNDNGEWNQIDKVGHAWTAYSEAVYATYFYHWGGLERKKSAVIGAAMAFTFQMGIEVLDGFSVEWGASSGDIVANTSGALLALGQELAWQEQRILFKYTSHKIDYSHLPQEVQNRAIALYGDDNWGQRLLKDYNGQSYWLSFSPLMFSNKAANSKYPKWLNIAIGYGTNNIFGGFKNQWEDDAGTTYDYTHINRQRQLFLSLDVDLTKIKTRYPFLRAVFIAFNVLKIPAPAVEWNTDGEVKFHPFY